MQSRLIRATVFACSLLLVLPTGWCCLFADCLRESQAGANAAIPVPTACCHPCCPQQTQSHPNQGKRPEGPHPERCPCTDRQAVATVKQSVEKPVSTFALAAVSAPVKIKQLSFKAIGDCVTIVDSPTVPIHVSKCLWLC
jgi:hypothetical protein